MFRWPLTSETRKAKRQFSPSWKSLIRNLSVTKRNSSSGTHWGVHCSGTRQRDSPLCEPQVRSLQSPSGFSGASAQVETYTKKGLDRCVLGSVDKGTLRRPGEEQHFRTVKGVCDPSTQDLGTNPTKLDRPCLHCKDFFYILKIFINLFFCQRANNKLGMHTLFLSETIVWISPTLMNI